MLCLLASISKSIILNQSKQWEKVWKMPMNWRRPGKLGWPQTPSISSKPLYLFACLWPQGFLFSLTYQGLRFIFIFEIIELVSLEHKPAGMPSLDKASLLPQPPTLHGVVSPLALLGVLGGVIVLLHHQAGELSYLASKKKKKERIRFSDIFNSCLNHFCPLKKAGRGENMYQHTCQISRSKPDLTTILTEGLLYLPLTSQSPGW